MSGPGICEVDDDMTPLALLFLAVLNAKTWPLCAWASTHSADRTPVVVGRGEWDVMSRSVPLCGGLLELDLCCSCHGVTLTCLISMLHFFYHSQRRRIRATLRK